jgi:hypothetical protein
MRAARGPGRVPAGGRGAALVALAVLGLLGAFYLPLLGRGFTSEDFLLIRFLRQEPP